jgi:hypothetical protein
MARRASRAAANETTTEENTVTTPNFDEPATEVEQVNDGDIAGTENTDFDVDAPEAEDVVAPVAEGTAAAPTTKAKTESTRPPVPEGKVSPVAFAKILTTHLRKEHETLGVRLAEDKAVAPQVVYSYIKNNAEGSKNPFPATKSEGRAAVVDADAALEWWDAKDIRVKGQKTEKAAKDAAKAAKAADTKALAEGVAPTEPQAELVEAE